MGRRRQMLPSGVSTITLGNVAVAISVAAMLAAGPRLLGHDAFVGLGLAWTATTLFGYGLAMPTEQLITRRTSARDPRGTARPGRALAVICVLACAALFMARDASHATDTFPLALPSAIVGLVGWAVLAMARGRVAGAGELQTYARTLAVEAAARILLVASAVLLPSGAAPILAAAVGVPVVVAAIGAIASLPRARPALTDSSATPRGRAAEQLTFVVVAAGYQVCLSSAPLILAWRLDSSLQVGLGAFVIANSYYRLAAVLGGGFATHALVSLSGLWSEGQIAAFRRQLWHGVLGAAAITAVATACAAALGPVVVPLLNGRDPNLPGVVVASLAASTVMATAAAVATTGLMASEHGTVAASWWTVGALVTVAVVAMAATIGSTVATALVVGPATVLVGVLLSGARLSRATAPRPDPT